jgi:fatty acid desaturase
MIRHPADRIPVLIITALTMMDLMVYFVVDNLWILACYFLLMIIPKALIAAWNHHHQHTKTFRWTPLNRALELCYALHTGVTSNLWLLHHVLGHHHNYLDQTVDQSRWKRDDGSVMGVMEYSMTVAVTAYYRGFLVGREHPRLYRIHLIYTIVTLAMLMGLLTYRPIPALFLFLLPMLTTLFITAWATFDHHAGLDEDEDHFSASHNIKDKLFNFLTGNLGYHTAHHYRQGMHWSALPGLHEEIEAQIPQRLYIEPFWVLFGQYLQRRFGGQQPTRV